MKQSLLVLGLLWIFWSTAQMPAVGEQFPYNKVITSKNKAAEKLIKDGVPHIFDFFASGCIVCFKSLPKIKELQDEFKTRMQFIMVGLEDATIRKTYQRFEERYSLSFPVVFDSVLPRQLGIGSYPHYLWIDRDNVVRAITGPDEVNQSNIENFIAGKAISMNAHESILFNPARLLLDSNNGGISSSMRFRSLLSEYSIGQTAWLPNSIYSGKNASRFQVLAAKLPLLYRYAYLGVGFWESNDSLNGRVYPHVVIDPLDSTERLKIDLAKSYCYSLATTIEDFDFPDLQQAMQNDLENYFGYEGFVSERMMPYWSLRVVDEASGKKLRTKGGKFRGELRADGVLLINGPVSELLRLLSIRNPFDHPFINNTGINFNIDIAFDAIPYDLTDVQEKLLVKGLKLEKDYKMMKVILLKPKAKMAKLQL